MNAKRIAKNLLYSVLSQMITISLGLMIPRLILLGYGSETNGLLNSVTQMLVYLSLFEAGVQLVAVQSLYKPVSADDREAINRILSAVNISYRKTGMVYLGVLLALAAVYPFLVSDSNLEYRTVFRVVFLSGLGNVVLFFFQGKYRILLQAEGKNYLLTNLHTIINVLNHMARAVLIVLGYDIVTVVFATSAIGMIQAGYICVLIWRKYPWIDLKRPPDFAAISQRNAALVHQLSGMVFQNTDVLILTVFCGLKVVSVYSVYKLITSHLGAFLQSLYAGISFALGQRFHTDRSLFVRTIDTVDVYFGCVVFSVYTVAAILFLPFIRLYTKGVTDIGYDDPVLGLLFVLAELLTYSRLAMMNTINYAGHFQKTLPRSLIETSINLSVSLIGVKFLGIYGVLLGTIAALCYRNVDIFLYTNHKILNRSAGKTFCIYAVDAIVFTLILLAVNPATLCVESYLDFMKIGLFLMPVILGIYVFVLSALFSGEKKMFLKAVKTFLGKHD